MCIITDCERDLYVRGYCRRHYNRLWLYGDPLGYGPKEEKGRTSPRTADGQGEQDPDVLAVDFLPEQEGVRSVLFQFADSTRPPYRLPSPCWSDSEGSHARSPVPRPFLREPRPLGTRDLAGQHAARELGAVQPPQDALPFGSSVFRPEHLRSPEREREAVRYLSEGEA